MIAIVIAAGVVVLGIFFLLGDKYGVEHMKIVTATPTDLAQTMLQDEFYSTYRESTIITTGKIASIARSSGTATVTFPTQSEYQTLCQFAGPEPKLARGQTITVIAEGALAERQSTAVLFTGCRLLK